ncbi:MAG: response regulator [Candidatus Nitrohelix vancouverensis]|uniref:histidine kinase n=1 Tax=Candidatus Nitrohelix vancouverensis TaxID=2705534 RepID=A0A7T0C4A5_9BACT|nr:MAG: response regulator [Candidatus Nitrohelix vancouverensis]
MDHLKSLSLQAVGIFVAGVVLSVFAFDYSWKQKQSAWVEQLRQEALEDTLILVGKLEVAEREMLGILSMFRSTGRVEEGAFQTYVFPLLNRNDFIDGFQWAPMVQHDQLDEFIQKMKSEGRPRFRILQKGNRAVPNAELNDEEYFPLLFTLDKRSGQDEIGFNLSSDPQAQQAIYDARDSGFLSSMETMEADESGDKKIRIHVYAPFYDHYPIPEFLAERRANFLGVIHGIYHVEKMVRDMVAPYMHKGMNLVVYKGFDQDRKLFGRLWENPKTEFQTPVNFANSRWLLVWQADYNFLGGPDLSVPFWLGGSLFGGAFLLAVIFQMLASRTRHVENLVNIRTGELTEANLHLTEEVSAREKAEMDLLAAKDEAEVANRAKSVFLANMSHEIRTPMNAILGYSQIMIRRRDLPTWMKKNISNILSSGNHLLQIINDILDISKIEAGKMEVHKVDFDLNRLLQEIDWMISPKAREKQLSLSVSSPGEGNRIVFGDELKLRQTLINLLDNAVKFTDQGWVSLSVTERAEGWYHFKIEDTGRGMTADFAERLYRPFQQETERLKRGGTGLGLAISKKQVELMGGDLKCDSTQEEGSRFAFTLQLPPGSEEGLISSDASEGNLRKQNGDTIHALIVDDDPMSREILESILNGAGVATRTAADGMEALAMIDSAIPDLVFMDMRMPAMNGADTIRAIRMKYSGMKNIIGISASALDDERLHYLSQGCREFIPKPFGVDDVLSCVSRIMRVTTPPKPRDALADKVEAPALSISDSWRKRIVNAAGMHNMTELKQCCNELASQGANGKALSAALELLVSNYDTKGILKLLQTIPESNER